MFIAESYANKRLHTYTADADAMVWPVYSYLYFVVYCRSMAARLEPSAQRPRTFSRSPSEKAADGGLGALPAASAGRWSAGPHGRTAARLRRIQDERPLRPLGTATGHGLGRVLPALVRRELEEHPIQQATRVARSRPRQHSGHEHPRAVYIPHTRRVDSRQRYAPDSLSWRMESWSLNLHVKPFGQKTRH